MWEEGETEEGGGSEEERARGKRSLYLINSLTHWINIHCIVSDFRIRNNLIWIRFRSVWE